MPVVYPVACSNCRYVSPISSEGYIAVIVDELSSSEFVHPEESCLIILAHPLESLIMEELGFSYEAAARGGRLLRVQHVICRVCGTSYEIRRLWAGATACTTCLALLLVSVGLAVLAYWQTQSPLVSFLTGWLGVWVLAACAEWAANRSIRRRHQDRVRQFDRGPGCPHCGSPKHLSLRWRWRALPCPECGQRSLRVHPVGIS
jgi:hypothetical protein